MTNRILRCEVFVDQIKSFAVVVRTHSLYKEEEETLELEAQNSHGDTFSSLEGLHFQWELVPEEMDYSASTSVLQIVPWQDSNLDIHEIFKSMERQGLQTSKILVRGTQTGKTTVVARLIDPGYVVIFSLIA